MKLISYALAAMLATAIPGAIWAQGGSNMADVAPQATPWGARTPAPTAPADSTRPKNAKLPASSSGGSKSSPEVTARSVSATRAAVAQGKRDPFSSVVQTSGEGPACGVGKKCLVPNQVVLKGVVKGPDGMLAVVENQQRRSYFLRENDPVFNGQVVRITADSIVFREKVLDKLGHEQTREVVKRISGGRPAV